MQVIKATVSVPRNGFEGYVGRVFLASGKVIKVMKREVCEAQEYGGAFTWDNFPFETKAECESAVRRKVAQLR